MISKAVCTSTEGAIKYYEAHLSAADYFSVNENQGKFMDKVAQRLGLNEAMITREKFVAFVECDMKKLGAHSKRQRISEIKYIEFTYSPPKAVSIVAAMDDRIKKQLYQAVKEELRWFETQVMVRDRRGNLAHEEITKPTGEMIAALFQHETSRTNDPDFHVYALIGNMTWDAERKGYFAIHYGQMLEMRKTLDARIHNNLAARMSQLGYQVESAPCGFGLKEVPAIAIDMFSERSHQVKTVKAILQRGYTAAQITSALKGLSDDEKRRLIDQQAVTLTRPKKVPITSKTLKKDVIARLIKAGVGIPQPSGFPVKAQMNLTEAVFQGTQIAFEKESVVRLDCLLGEIVRLAPGAVSNEALTVQLRDDRRFLIRHVEGHEVVTTRQILGEEKTLLTSVIMGMDQMEPLQHKYIPPAEMIPTPQRIDELIEEARSRGEENYLTTKRKSG